MRRSTLACLGMLVLSSGTAHAVDIRTLVMPGPVIAGHADVEKDCGRCHRTFDASAQTQLCLSCHEAVQADLAEGAGLHGRAAAGGPSAACRSCHGDHKGREADIVGLDRETFDHARSDFALLGAHQRVACERCHASDEKYREAVHDCLACHRDDDRHAGRLGEDCAACHVADAWSRARFDHDKTQFRLEGGHIEVACGLCHPGERYRETPRDCVACHRLDDVHRGGFGAACADCHGVKAWKERKATGFDHDRDTKFPLRGVHRKIKCKQCHDDSRPGVRLERSCVGCHRADDEHAGRFGDGCDRCHAEQAWKRTTFDHARDAKLALEGAHRDLACRACHPGVLGQEKLARDCVGCHADDDVHRGQEGKRCDACHDSRSWTGRVAFDHDLSSFPLLGLHALAACEDCHEAGTYRDASEACAACHEKRDVHETRLGANCELCHNPNDWQRWRFSHDEQTDFALHGAHAGLDCLGCHRNPVRGKISLGKRCESCHASDDPHRGAFGSRCGDCHGEKSWNDTRLGR